MPRLQLVPDIARLRLLCFLALLGGKPSRENMEDSDALAGASGAETAEEGQRGQLGEEEDVLAGAFRNFGTFFSGGGLWRAAARAQEAVQEVTASFQRTNWAQEIREFQSGIFAEAAEDARALSEVVQSQHLQERSREALRAARERSAQLAAQLEAANPELSGALRGAGQSLARFAGSIVERSRKFAEAVVQEALLVTPGPTGRAGAGDSMQTRGDVCAVQRDSSTYLEDPPHPGYAAWRARFDVGSRDAEIAALLAEDAFMRDLLSRLVPAVVSSEDFWARYFFRVDAMLRGGDAGDGGDDGDRGSSGAQAGALAGSEAGERARADTAAGAGAGGGAVAGQVHETDGVGAPGTAERREGGSASEAPADWSRAKEGGSGVEAAAPAVQDDAPAEARKESAGAGSGASDVPEKLLAEDDDWLDGDDGAGDPGGEVDEDWADWE